MGNSFPGLFCRFTAPRPGRRKAAHAVAASLEETAFDIGETNQPMAVFGFGHANGFADQRLADEAGRLFPWHRQGPPHRLLNLLPISPVYSVTHLSGPYLFPPPPLRGRVGVGGPGMQTESSPSGASRRK